MKPILNLVVRTNNETGEPLICWDDSLPQSEAVITVGVYFTSSQHHESVDADWYYRETTACEDPKQAKKLFEAYTKDWEGHSVPVLRKVLKSGKRGPKKY